MGSSQQKHYQDLVGISDGQRIRMVREIFSTITARYDFLNHFLSLRRDVFWRGFAVRKMRFFKTCRFLDVATGTGDLAIDALRFHPYIQVVGLDFVKEMLACAKEKVARKTLQDRIRPVLGDALCLPFPARAFDTAAMAFGIRNIPDKLQALREMARVVVPGGRVLILEMTFPEPPGLGRLYAAYLNHLLPFLARMSPNPLAYYYLGESIMGFPTQDRFLSLMKEAGLKRVRSYPLTLGICTLFSGQRT